jgi:Na+-translocating ferredoxin:NAD+ oxidoreductase RnfG subunit
MIFFPVVALYAHAEIYMSESQAVSVLLPGQVTRRADVDLSAADIKKIEAASGQKVRSPHQRIYKSKTGDVVFVDQVLGKHEFITYATAISKDGKVIGTEILEYRESYGQQVREPSWLKQFVGKDAKAPLHLDEDIKNISGATLSSSHIAGGIKRLLQTFEALHGRI